MILGIFSIFGDLSLDDSYKINSYKKMCVLGERGNRGIENRQMSISFHVTFAFGQELLWCV
jgi:hypothetical protein